MIFSQTIKFSATVIFSIEKWPCPKIILKAMQHLLLSTQDVHCANSFAKDIVRHELRTQLKKSVKGI